MNDMTDKQMLNSLLASLVDVIEFSLSKASNKDKKYGEDYSLKHNEAMRISHSIVFVIYTVLKHNNLVEKSEDYSRYADFKKTIESFLEIYELYSSCSSSINISKE